MSPFHAVRQTIVFMLSPRMKMCSTNSVKQVWRSHVQSQRSIHVTFDSTGYSSSEFAQRPKVRVIQIHFLSSLIWGVPLWAAAEVDWVSPVRPLPSVSSPPHSACMFPPFVSFSWSRTAAAAQPGWAGTARWTRTLVLYEGSTPVLSWW